jgi:YegS/Rv2252/BmrU family lipid kinase
MSENKKVWKVIVNPHSGSGKTLPVWGKAQAMLLEAGIEFEAVFTRAPHHAIELVKEASRCGFRRFIAVGGDGTAHEVLNGIANSAEQSQLPLSDFTLAVIPIGSGNDWIKGHHIPRKLSDIVKLLQAEHFTFQDIVKVVDSQSVSYMLNIGGIGFDAHVCKQVNRQKAQGKSGRLLYVNSLIYNILHCRPAPIRMVADGVEVFSGPFYSIAFGLGPYSGGGMRQCPSAVLNDGMLDYTVIPRLPIWYIFSKIPRLFNGTLEKEKDLIFGRCKKVEISMLPAAQNAETEQNGGVAQNGSSAQNSGSQMEEIVEADGEIVAHTPVVLEVCSSALRVLTNL